jgi:hypothetical protein
MYFKMKLRYFIIPVIIFFFLPAANLFALGQATSMGNLQTVVPSGPFDATRNPALIATQTSENSTGLFVNYVSHYAKASSAEAGNHQDWYLTSTGALQTSNSSKNEIKIEDPDITAYNINIANSTKLKNSTIGFAFVNNGNDQYSIEEREISSITSGTINYPTVTLYQESNEKSKKTELNPALIVSLGFNISNTSSVGFQILAKYSNSTEKKEYYENRTAPSIYEKNERITKEINAISGELGFGYFSRGDNSEIGLLIRSGDFSWIKKSLSANTNRLMPILENYRTEESITLNGKHTSGPSVEAGGYKRLSSFFALALESKFTMQNSFTNRELELADKQSGPTSVKIKKSTNTTKNSVLFNGGMQFNLSNNLSFNTGAGYLKVYFGDNGEDNNGSHREENSINYGLLTVGFDYILSKNVEIALIATGIYYSIEQNRYGRSKNISGIYTVEEENYLRTKSKGYYLNYGLGISMSF